MTLEELEKRIGTLEDIEAIKEMHRKYVYGLICQQWDDMVECFTEDATAAIAEHEPRRGKTEIAKLLKDVIAKQVSWDWGHFVTQPVISVEGDKARGHWILYLFFPEPEVKWLQARYDCEYVKMDGKWKFSDLKFKAPWPEPPK
jgi:ketosteroid isomerase-like protein